MIHDLRAGHFGRDGTVVKPLDMRIVRRLLDELGDIDAGGGPMLGGWKVRFEDGCVQGVRPSRGSPGGQTIQGAVKLVASVFHSRPCFIPQGAVKLGASVFHSLFHSPSRGCENSPASLQCFRA